MYGLRIDRLPVGGRFVVRKRIEEGSLEGSGI
jgi:hypothetical protein